MDRNGAHFVKMLWIGLDFGEDHKLKTILYTQKNIYTISGVIAQSRNEHQRKLILVT